MYISYLCRNISFYIIGASLEGCNGCNYTGAYLGILILGCTYLRRFHLTDGFTKEDLKFTGARHPFYLGPCYNPRFLRKTLSCTHQLESFS